MLKIVLLSLMLVLTSALKIKLQTSIATALDPNVHGEFDNSDVKEMHGSSAVTYVKDKHDLPLLVLAYHPQCPHC